MAHPLLCKTPVAHKAPAYNCMCRFYAAGLKMVQALEDICSKEEVSPWAEAMLHKSELLLSACFQVRQLLPLLPSASGYCFNAK
eukprot:1159548-Pelagomonas_calceolata.AAC.6